MSLDFARETSASALRPVRCKPDSFLSHIQEQAAIWCDGGRLLAALRDTAGQDPARVMIGGGLDELEHVIATTDTSTIATLPTVPDAPEPDDGDGEVPVENLVAEALTWLLLTRPAAQRERYLRLAERLIDRRVCSADTFQGMFALGLLAEGLHAGFLPSYLYGFLESYVTLIRPEWAEALPAIERRDTTK